MKGKDKQQPKEKSLKDQNTASLVTILIVNIAIFAVVLPSFMAPSGGRSRSKYY
jgi:hypothetical protein